MIRYVSSVASIALLVALPASAQLLGGAGGLGGMTGIGGGAPGMLSGGIDRLPASTDAVIRSRAAPRERRAVAPQRPLPAAEADARAIGTAAVDDRSSGARTATSGSIDSGLAVDARAIPTRGIVAAQRRGLQRVTETARGVPVFVAAAVPLPAVRVAPVAYPVYAGGAYGGGDVIQGDAGGYMDRQYGDLRRGVEGTGATVFRRGNDLVVQLPGDVTFAFDRAEIRPRFISTLSTVARILDDYPGTDVEIMGHTDAIGSDQYNLALSERRGRNVADFLVAANTDPRRLVVEALGKSEPIASNATVAGRAANRRVEMVLHPRNG